MTNLTKSLLDAISIIADRSAEEVFSDTTIKVIVKKVVSASEGKYLVNYNNGDFYVYTQSGSKDIYEVNEQIYVLVPEGDMSQKKFIIGRVQNDDEEEYLSYEALSSSSLNDYITIGKNLVVENSYLVDDIVSKTMYPLSLNSQTKTGINSYYCYLRNPEEVKNSLQNEQQNNFKYNTIEYPTVDIDEEAFSNSAKQTKALLLRANFKASLGSDTNVSNYGIIVNIAFSDKTNPQIDDDGNISYPSRLVAYVLDTSKMTGDPMQYYDYVSQYIISNFDSENYLYVDSVVAFIEGIANDDETEEVIGETGETGEEEKDSYIYIDNIEIIALDEISAVNGDYKLKLTTPQGNTIKEGRNDILKVVANMTYLNQNITKDTTFYWGVKDPSITYVSEGYHFKLGSGYRYLDIQSDELELGVKDLTAAENIFVCVASYESSIVLKTLVSIYNNNNNLEISIESDQGTKFQFSEGSPTLTCLINGKADNYQSDSNYSDSAFTFIWSKEDSEFGSIVLDKTEDQLRADRDKELQDADDVIQVMSYYSTRISQVADVSYPNGVNGPKIKCELKNVNNYVTYSCSVYRAGIYVGYASITLQNSKSIINNNYYITITNGTQVFQYDEAGIAPNSIRKQEPIEILDLTAVFHDPQGVEIVPKSVRWIVPQNNTLIKLPVLGLLVDAATNEQYYTGNIFPLDIKDTYDSTCGDNQVIAVVTHIDGTEYRQSSNLLFTKIGEIGTNGTNTVLKINEKLTDVPADECLTIIKDSIGQTVRYNGVNSKNTDDPVLEAELYSNNTQLLGYTTKWTLAGTSETQGRNYKVETNQSDGACIIKYNSVPANDKLDTRIVEAQVRSHGEYYHSFYGIPAIEYRSSEYSYIRNPIKIIKKDTLKTILYDSNGSNPSYNINQGIHVELDNWPENGYLKWKVESGFEKKNQEYSGYTNPNLLLAINPRATEGSMELEINSDINDIQYIISNIQEIEEFYIDNSNDTIKKYISNFVTDVERIVIDNLSSVADKLTLLKNRIEEFKENSPNDEDAYITTLYGRYNELFTKMTGEYNLCKDVNRDCAKVYNEIQDIWKSEWPNVITSKRLFVNTDKPEFKNIVTIENLINLYQKAYNDRSNDSNNAAKIPVRNEIFKEDFYNIITNNTDGLDKCYSEYNTNNEDFNSILLEYTKVLIAYIKVLINETTKCLDDSTYPLNYYGSDGTAIDFKENIYKRYEYSILYDWNNNYIVGKNIYDIVSSTQEVVEIYDNIRKLYEYYQTICLNVKKYQIEETSKTLNAWNAILNGQKPDLLNYIYVVPNKTFNGLYMNNNVVGTAYIKETVLDEETNQERIDEIEIAKIYIPIIMTLNTYELANLNGWDGTSIEIGDDHILTPQIGAGIKDSTTNTFTGMVMGVISNSTIDDNKEEPESTLEKIKKADKVGLIGYSNGKQSLFINSKTGEASFGLPEDDNQINEGRIELVPGGLSKIGNWKIGNRFLYNIVDGSCENGLDDDARDPGSKEKIVIPHDKHGIILSSDKPYIHVKGELYSDKNISGINYEDEYNNINPEDSLELRIDPGNKSLFSIVQHTSGFGDEDIEDLHFGYKESGLDDVVVVKDYVANKNTGENPELGGNAEYYIYRIDTDDNGKAKPYYTLQDTSGITKLEDEEDNKWTNEITSILTDNTLYLKDALPVDNFKKTTDDAVFSIGTYTGTIMYNPNNLIWDTDNTNQLGNNVTGISNRNGWQSITKEVSSNNITVNLQYSKENIKTPIIKDLSIGKIYNNTNYNIHQIEIKDCDIFRELTNVILNNYTDNYIQFYITPESDDDNNSVNTINFDQAILKSEKISISNNQEKINVRLFSVDSEKFIEKKKSDNEIVYYNLGAYLNIGNYTISCDCFCDIKSSPSTHKGLPAAPYGVAKITTRQSEAKSFTTLDGTINNISGSYWFTSNSSTAIKFSFSGSGELEYDFVIWKQDDEEVKGVGRTFYSNNRTSNAKICKDIDKTENNLEDFLVLNFVPSVDNPCYISFYPKGTYITETTSYVVQSEVDNNTTGTETASVNVIINNGVGNESYGNIIVSGDYDDVSNIATENTTVVTKYKYINKPSMENISTYDVNHINWGNWTNNNYNNEEVSWDIKINQLKFGTIYGFEPATEAKNKLCIIQDNTYIQGIKYAKTYWDQTEYQRIVLYKDYYQWVNREGKSKKQYGYIDITENKGVYYKYIKTLKKDFINKLFETQTNLDGDISIPNNSTPIHNWIDIPISFNKYKNYIYWKDYIRVGLDENGRFFSAGLQDKKSYGRTGKIYAFGKVPNLYGQEIRVQQDSEKNYPPIIKIFSSLNDMTTTYLTQGRNDDGNISVRTANNGYIELGVAKQSNNNTNTIPELTSFIKIKDSDNNNDNNIMIQSNEFTNIILNNDLIINAENEIVLSSKNNIVIKNNIEEKKQVKIESNECLITSSTSNSATPVLTEYDSNNITNGYYLIKASDHLRQIKKDDKIYSEPGIQLSLTKKDYGIKIFPDSTQIKVGSGEININNSRSNFKAGEMEFFLDNSASKLEIGLQHGKSIYSTYIKIKPNAADSSKHEITLHSNLGGNILIAGKTTISNPVIINDISAEALTINGQLNVRKKTMTYDDIYIQAKSNGQKSSIYLYKNNSKYLRIEAAHLEKIYEWYNKYRWKIGVGGNTLFLTKVDDFPEGSYDESKNSYSWNASNTFSGYNN